MRKYKVLLSGASGFVGQNLLPYLDSRYYSLQVLSLRHGWRNQVLSESDIIVHLAGKAHDTNNTSDSQEYFRINTGLTKQLFDVFIESTARDFIYFSSVKAVADTFDGILSEDEVANPRTPYGQSKRKAEEYLLLKDLPSGKRVFIFRPCMIHGPGNKGNLNLLYRVVKKGIPYPLAAFENKRSFLSIENLLFIIDQLLTNPNIPGGVYNVADDEPLSTSEVIRIMAAANNSSPRLWSVAPAFIKAAAKVGDTLHLPLNSDRLKKLTESYVVSNQKIKAALGIESLPVSSRDGLFKTIKSFQTK